MRRGNVAARLVGVCYRTFQRYLNHHEEAGLYGLIGNRLSQVSHRRTPVDEVIATVEHTRASQIETFGKVLHQKLLAHDSWLGQKPPSTL